MWTYKQINKVVNTVVMSKTSSVENYLTAFFLFNIPPV